MKNKILEIYLLSICLVCSTVLIINIMKISPDIVELIDPSLSPKYKNQIYDTNERFYKARYKREISFKKYTEEDIKNQRNKASQDKLYDIKLKAKKQIIQHLPAMIFVVIFFTIHLIQYFRIFNQRYCVKQDN